MAFGTSLAISIISLLALSALAVDPQSCDADAGSQDGTKGVALLQKVAVTSKKAASNAVEDDDATGTSNPRHATKAKGIPHASMTVQNLEKSSETAEQPVKNKAKAQPDGFQMLYGVNQGVNYSKLGLQLLFGIFYYFLVVSKYPSYTQLPIEPTAAAKELQDMNEVSATLETSFQNCLLSWLCIGPRSAHTFYSTLGFNYWACCIISTCFPCCTLWYVNSFTNLNEKLGGEKRGIFMGLLCACFCSCCVVAQDAETLDIITDLQSGCCGLRNRLHTNKD